jgi:hypothetical protein
MACKKTDNISVTVDEPFKKGRLKVELIEVQDSRCPEGVSCFWEGNAKVTLKVSHKKKLDTISLNTHQKFSQDTLINGMTISLLKLNPYPKDGEQLQLKDYSVNIKIE